MESVYLLQPAELKDTNIYKVGYTKSHELKRCIDGYKKGTKIFFTFGCNNAKELETLLIYNFNRIFNLHTGNEYFEGDIKHISAIFLRICQEYVGINLIYVNNQKVFMLKNILFL